MDDELVKLLVNKVARINALQKLMRSPGVAPTAPPTSTRVETFQIKIVTPSQQPTAPAQMVPFGIAVNVDRTFQSSGVTVPAGIRAVLDADFDPAAVQDDYTLRSFASPSASASVYLPSFITVREIGDGTYHLAFNTEALSWVASKIFGTDEARRPLPGSAFISNVLPPLRGAIQPESTIEGAVKKVASRLAPYDLTGLEAVAKAYISWGIQSAQGFSGVTIDLSGAKTRDEIVKAVQQAAITLQTQLQNGVNSGLNTFTDEFFFKMADQAYSGAKAYIQSFLTKGSPPSSIHIDWAPEGFTLAVPSGEETSVIYKSGDAVVPMPYILGEERFGRETGVQRTVPADWTSNLASVVGEVSKMYAAVQAMWKLLPPELQDPGSPNWNNPAVLEAARAKLLEEKKRLGAIYQLPGGVTITEAEALANSLLNPAYTAAGWTPVTALLPPTVVDMIWSIYTLAPKLKAVAPPGWAAEPTPEGLAAEKPIPPV